MRVKVVKYEEKHLHEISISEIHGCVSKDALVDVLPRGVCFTAIFDNRPIAVGGYFIIGGLPCLAAVMGKDSGRYMLQLTRLAKDFIGRMDSLYSCADTELGHKWHRILGMKRLTDNIYVRA